MNIEYNTFKWKRGSSENGSALVLSLLILVVMTILSMLLLKGHYLTIKTIRKPVDAQQALYYAEAGVEKALWLLSGNEGKSIHWRVKQEPVELFTDQFASVTVEAWGGFLRVTSYAEYRDAVKAVTVLAGQKIPDIFDYAIVLGEDTYPLVLTGNAFIKGDVVVGIKGVESGAIKGKGHTGKTLVEGNVHKKTRLFMPGFTNRLFESALADFRKYLETEGKDYPPDIQPGALNVYSVSGPFEVGPAFADTLRLLDVLVCSDDLFIEDVTFHRPLKLISGGKIEMRRAAGHADILVYGDQGVAITEGSRLSGQFFSPAEITVSGQSEMLYPAVLYCPMQSKNDELLGRIMISGQSKVRGSVILSPHLKTTGLKKNDCRVYLEHGSHVVGLIYSEMPSHIEGLLWGHISASSFYLYISPTHYRNWIQDASIDRTRLPDEFVLPLHFSDRPLLKKMRWELIDPHLHTNADTEAP